MEKQAIIIGAGLAGVTAGVGVYLGQRFSQPRVPDQAEVGTASRRHEPK